MTSPRNVLVTGGSGFVGSALVAALSADGVRVSVVDRRAHPDPSVHSVVGELTDARIRAEALGGADGAGVDAVVHLAAITSVLRSVDRPAETFDANVAVTQGLLEGCREFGIGSFVLASTNAVVGDVGHARVDETVPLRPLTPYGATKAACEMLLSGYAGSYGIAAAALRFTNIYGPGMAHKDSFVPRLMRAARSGAAVTVYGDGLQSRDLVHVDDVVAAIRSALDLRYRGTAIIGSGRSVTVLDLIAAVRAVTGAPLPIEHVPAKAGEMPAVIVDITRARVGLGYEPAMSLADGLATVWKDFS